MSNVLSQRLREWRKSKELSQEKLGEIVSATAGRPVAQTVIASYENRGLPTAWFLEALANAFDDLDMNRLLRDEKKKIPEPPLTAEQRIRVLRLEAREHETRASRCREQAEQIIDEVLEWYRGVEVTPERA